MPKAKKRVKKKSNVKVSKAPKGVELTSGLAVAALIINLFIPGLGTLIAGRIKSGAWQIVLLVISAPLSFIYIGFITYLIVWIWALITSIQLIKESN
ncbi:hypothetical protein COU54_05130 [Candidatus Pacearchaeota archaeon CG10_big_fil_rev_8_21_14_0_10_31_24]|nr:MAG: hypothetical protein COU54_05130 [Candidatus Pacearchaeota archaeon CG10_big_fil_rev_8_21_14_0_10_31_24]